MTSSPKPSRTPADRRTRGRDDIDPNAPLPPDFDEYQAVREHVTRLYIPPRAKPEPAA